MGCAIHPAPDPTPHTRQARVPCLGPSPPPPHHAEQAGAGVLGHKVFVVKPRAVDGDAAGAVACSSTIRSNSSR